MTVPTRK